MQREFLSSCWPYLAAMIVGVGLLWMTAKLSGGKLRVGHLRRLHVDQRGGVQSLSFVLTIPVFLMIMLFLVQLSQVIIAKMVVEYAAIAACRSASVWIGANLGQAGDEQENQISFLQLQEVQQGSDGQTWAIYKSAPGSRKVRRIHLAAALACVPLCPSRNVGAGESDVASAALPSILRAYYALAPSQRENSRVPARIRNKLAYALSNTWVDLEIRHKSSEPPFSWYDIRPYRREFSWNEVGWQDQVLVTVIHDFALLPGPGRFLIKSEKAAGDATAPGGYLPGFVRRRGDVYVHRLTATARMSNEGEKFVKPYVQW